MSFKLNNEVYLLTRAVLLLQTVFLLLFLSFSQTAHSQTPPNREIAPQQVSLPKSPETESLFDFSPFPVSHSSGTVNTLIPIYTIESGRIEVPISLSYNSSGIKVQDIAGSVGLGWNLNFGYYISVSEEEMKAMPFEVKTYKSELDALSATNRGIDWVTEMQQHADGWYRSMNTVYNFRIGDNVGAFYFDNENQIHIVGEVDNVKISAIGNPSSARLVNGFKITTDEGIEYRFDQRETAFRATQTYPGPVVETSGFWVSQITDIVSGRKVTFEYVNKPVYFTYQTESYNRIYKFGPFPEPGEVACLWNPQDHSYNSTPYEISGLQIKTIEWDDGVLQFDSENTRLDIDKSKITRIRTLSKVWPRVQVKQVDFHQSYFISPASGVSSIYERRLRLDSVSFSQEPTFSTAYQQTYSFAYNSSPPAYRIASNGTHNNRNIDYWGFYNGNGSQHGTIPEKVRSDFLSTTNIPDPYPWSSNREANPEYTQVGILTKITYPTKGFATFEYENHTLPGYYLGDVLGGLRIKKIKYYNAADDVQPIIKTFKYLSSRELTPASVNMYAYRKWKRIIGREHHYAYCQYNYDVGIASSEPNYQITYHEGSPVIYDKVEEIDGSEEQNSGKIIYSFDYEPSFMNYSLSSFVESGGYKAVSVPRFGRGKLLAKEYYKRTSNILVPYQLVSKEVYTYIDRGAPGRFNIGFGVSKNHSLTGSHPIVSWDLIGPEALSEYLTKANAQQVPINAFLYNDIYIYDNNRKISKVENFQYDNGAEIKITTSYFYDNPSHNKVTRKEYLDSKQAVRKIVYKYVQDRSSISDIDLADGYAFDALFSSNRLNDIIEESEYFNDELISKKRFKWRMQQNGRLLGMYVPALHGVERTNYIAASPWLRSTKLKVDDDSNILEQRENSGTYSSFMWDDHSLFPIAYAQNAMYEDIRYTSFEWGGKGKWDFQAGGASFNNQAFSGSQVYNLNGSNSISALNLNPSRTYLISYASRNGNYTIAGSEIVVSSASMNGWTFYQHKISGVSALTISGVGVIDEVRLYPLGASMNTYTHKPMVGLSSEIDSKNIVTNYEYDYYHRLKYVKDENGKIIRDFQSHYR